MWRFRRVLAASRSIHVEGVSTGGSPTTKTRQAQVYVDASVHRSRERCFSQRKPAAARFELFTVNRLTPQRSSVTAALAVANENNNPNDIDTRPPADDNKNNVGHNQSVANVSNDAREPNARHQLFQYNKRSKRIRQYYTEYGSWLGVMKSISQQISEEQQQLQRCPNETWLFLTLDFPRRLIVWCHYNRYIPVVYKENYIIAT